MSGGSPFSSRLSNIRFLDKNAGKCIEWNTSGVTHLSGDNWRLQNTDQSTALDMTSHDVVLSLQSLQIEGNAGQGIILHGQDTAGEAKGGLSIDQVYYETGNSPSNIIQKFGFVPMQIGMLSVINGSPTYGIDRGNSFRSAGNDFIGPIVKQPTGSFGTARIGITSSFTGPQSYYCGSWSDVNDAAGGNEANLTTLDDLGGWYFDGTDHVWQPGTGTVFNNAQDNNAIEVYNGGVKLAVGETDVLIGGTISGAAGGEIEIQDLENVDNVSSASDMTGDIVIDEAQERLYLKDDDSNIGYINLDGTFT